MTRGPNAKGFQRFLRRRRRSLGLLAALVLTPVLMHVVIRWTTSIEPPSLAPPVGDVTVEPAAPDLRRVGPAYAKHRGNILEVRLQGGPEALGHQHARLLYPEMVNGERELLTTFEQRVPTPMLRALLMDLAQVRFSGIDQQMRPAMRAEIAAEARGFSPDPFDDLLPTYHRFVFLHALYDIALSFERSPLVGCSSFILRNGAAADGHVLFARNFDFEATPFLDEGKAVFFVREDGRIPFASVAWPGLVGVVTGMNAEGVGLVVHGARAREPQAQGEPVVHAMRDVLARAKSTAEAVAVLSEKRALVAHLVLLADATGDVAVVERAPGESDTVRRPRGAAVALTNHFEGLLSTDPKNQEVEVTTSTRPRLLRLEERLANLPSPASVEDAVTVLRDRKAVGGGPLPLGHRRAIDGLVATHGVVMDLSSRVLWVTEGPHLRGPFVRFDAASLLGDGVDPAAPSEVVRLSEDPLLPKEQYDAWVRQGSPHAGGPP